MDLADWVKVIDGENGWKSKCWALNQDNWQAEYEERYGRYHHRSGKLEENSDSEPDPDFVAALEGQKEPVLSQVALALVRSQLPTRKTAENPPPVQVELGWDSTVRPPEVLAQVRAQNVSRGISTQTGGDSSSGALLSDKYMITATKVEPNAVEERVTEREVKKGNRDCTQCT